jgi:hypothetical protein
VSKTVEQSVLPGIELHRISIS